LTCVAGTKAIPWRVAAYTTSPDSDCQRLQRNGRKTAGQVLTSLAAASAYVPSVSVPLSTAPSTTTTANDFIVDRKDAFWDLK
jgi:hypothetical protein